MTLPLEKGNNYNIKVNAIVGKEHSIEANKIIVTGLIINNTYYNNIPACNKIKDPLSSPQSNQIIFRNTEVKEIDANDKRSETEGNDKIIGENNGIQESFDSPIENIEVIDNNRINENESDSNATGNDVISNKIKKNNYIRKKRRF
jgi:hypothetical protein